MTVEFTELAWEDFSYWLENDPGVVIKIRELIKSIQREPFQGLGKPEALRFGLRGFWSRRISGDHRLVYRISGSKGVDQRCTIIQCRFHYDGK